MGTLKLRLIELTIQFITAVLTIIFQPPLPLLAIPFMIIISTRTIFAMLEDNAK